MYLFNGFYQLVAVATIAITYKSIDMHARKKHADCKRARQG